MILIIAMIFPDAYFGIEFWWVLTSIVGSILTPLWHQILCFRVIVFWMIFCIDFEIDFRRLLAPFWSVVGSLLIPFWFPLVPFGSFCPPFGYLLSLASLWQTVHSLGVRFASCLSSDVFGLAFSDFLCYGASFLRISTQILRKFN